MDGGLLLGGLAFALIGAYLAVRASRPTESALAVNRKALRRVVGEARADRVLTSGFQRANVVYMRIFGGLLVVLGLVLAVLALTS